MNAATDYDDTYATLLALVADPYGAYKESNEMLARVLARTNGLTHGRRAPDALLAAVEALRAEVSAVLETRRRLDAAAKLATTAPRAEATSAPTGGTRVPLPPAPPKPLPPARQQPQYLDAL